MNASRSALTVASSLRPHVVVPTLVLIVLAGAYMEEQPGLGGDYAQYLLHAKALYEGRAYTDIPYIYTSLNAAVGPQAYPPGLPLMLVPVIGFTSPGDMWSVQLTMLMIAAFLVATVAVFFTLLDGPVFGFAVGLVTAIVVAPAALTPNSDVPFSLALWLMLLVESQGARSRPGSLVLVGILGGVAIATRTVGVVLIVAGLAWALASWRRGGLGWVGVAAVWGLVFWVTSVSIPSATSYGDQILLGPADLLRTVTGNVAGMRHAIVEGHLYPFSDNRTNDLYHLATAILTLIGAVLWLRGRIPSFMVLLWAAYLGLVAVWPEYDGRFLLPLVPLFAYWPVRGAVSLLNQLTPLSRSSAIHATVLALLALSLAHVHHRPGPKGPSSLRDSPDGRELLEHLRLLTRPEARAMFARPRVLAWETGLPSMATLDVPPSATLTSVKSNRITHLVLGDLGEEARETKAFRQFTSCLQGGFRLAFANGTFSVLESTDPGSLQLAAECVEPPGL